MNTKHHQAHALTRAEHEALLRGDKSVRAEILPQTQTQTHADRSFRRELACEESMLSGDSGASQPGQDF
jgi:hypothetical protein